MKTRVSVREGNSGILHLVYEDATQERYVPSYDLDAARSLLLAFQELRDGQGARLKENYLRDGINWFPTTVNYLHGRIFASYVRYEPLVKRILDGELDVHFEGQGDFARLVSLVVGGDAVGWFAALKDRLFNVLITVSNWITVRRCSADVLFFRFTPDDFRTRPAKSVLDQLGASYLEALGAERRLLFRNVFKRKPYYFFGRVQTENSFRCTYDLTDQDKYRQILFSAATGKIERMLSASVEEWRRHCRTLVPARVKTLYGIDDTQVIYPLLYACQRLGIRTVAHQHGAAYNRRHASYVMEGIDASEYRWFDTLVTWGQYWKDRFLAITMVHPPARIVVGSDLFEFAYGSGSPSARGRRNVLIPYEYLTNTYSVGRYIMKLIDLGYGVFFKPRPDEPVEAQMDAYCLPPEYRDRLTLVSDLTPEAMDQIDIVAGTASTLVYQLLSCGKIVWVLETDYKYMEDLAEQGYATLVRYEDLEMLDEAHFKPTKVDTECMFSSESLRDTLAKHVLGRV